jgi:hypothetical protein
MRVRIVGDTIEVSAAQYTGWSFAMQLAAIGRGDTAALQPGSAAPELEGNRVRLRRRGCEEWYVNHPLGTEGRAASD